MLMLTAAVAVIVNTYVAAAASVRSSGPSILNFLQENTSNRTLILNSAFQQIGTIPTSGSEAIGPDETLYVAFSDQGYISNALEIIAPPYKKITATLTFGGFGLTGVASDARTGVFAVTGNYIASPLGGPGFIRFFKPGTTRSCNYVPSAAGQLGDGLAFDRAGTLFSILNFRNTMIASVAGGCRAKQVIVHRMPAGFSPTGTIAFDSNDHLVMQTAGSAAVTTYAHPNDGPIGSPISTTTLARVDGSIPYMTALTADGKHLWASTYNGKYTTAEFPYPEGGDPIVVLHTTQGANMLAVFPPLRP
jgi:hypothetical protein